MHKNKLKRKTVLEVGETKFAKQSKPMRAYVPLWTKTCGEKKTGRQAGRFMAYGYKRWDIGEGTILKNNMQKRKLARKTY